MDITCQFNVALAVSWGTGTLSVDADGAFPVAGAGRLVGDQLLILQLWGECERDVKSGVVDLEMPAGGIGCASNRTGPVVEDGDVQCAGW